ncbi:MAG TPA: tripartite tricarboxylate transporter permease [Hyphomicrobiaceae bacterium]|jgi:TctA family transporter
MELLTHLAIGFATAFSPSNLLYCFLGVLLGTVIGVLPGIGTATTVAMLLPLTFQLEPTSSLIMLAGIYYGSQYGGSTTAIMVNLPGEASSAVTTIDGYQMARRGRAGPALAVAALGSFFAGTVATLLVLTVAQPLTAIALRFGPAEYFSLVTVGLVSSVALASGSILNALAMICLGLLISMTGTDIYTAMPRLTFGLPELEGGIDVAAIAAGAFGIGEIIRNSEAGVIARSTIASVKSIWPSIEDLKRMVGPTVRGTTIGSFLGVLPGSGALLSSFVAYNVEKKVSRNSAEFGKGAIEGVAAPEAANNAGAQTSFIPMLSLGLPSNVVMALMIGAMMMQGITPGPNVATTHPELFWGVIVSMWIGNAMLVLLNFPLIGIWIKLLSTPSWILYPAIVTFCCIGIYSLANNSFIMYILLVSGVGGYILVKLGCELPPFILGFILGPMLEEHFRRAMSLSGGDPMILVTRPISAALLAVAVVALIVVSLPAISRKRKEVFVEED